MADTIHLGYGKRGASLTVELPVPDAVSQKVEKLASLVEHPEIDSSALASAKKMASLAKNFAPKRTGLLRSGIVVKPGRERTSAPGKIVYDVWMDPALNDKFVPPSKSGKRYYYPASMEYGFRLRNGKKAAGHHYMRKAAFAHSEPHEKQMVDTVKTVLESEWK